MTFEAVVSARRDWIVALGLVTALKLVFVLVDPAMRFFLGDSASYLETAFTGWIPQDRSFLYGWLIGATAVPARSLHALLALQTAFGICSALLLYWLLRRPLRVSTPIALLAAALFAVEPAQLFYERMMMAEAAGLLAFLLHVCAIAAYTHAGRLRWIPVFALFGVLAVAFRISLLPTVLGLSGIAALIVGLKARATIVQRTRVQRAVHSSLHLILHLAVVVACTSVAHRAYTHWYGRLANTAPAYTARSGAFRLGLVAPLVQPHHLARVGIPPQALDELTVPLRDPRKRESHIWSEGGLIHLVDRHAADGERAARKISIRAAREDPLGFLRLGLGTTADYFVPQVADVRMSDDIGTRPLSPEMLRELREAFGYDAKDAHRRDTPVRTWFAASSPWLTACLFLLAPLALVALALGWRTPLRGPRLVLLFASLGLVASHVLFSHIVSFRYLHPLPWFVLANLAVIANLLRTKAGSGVRTPSSAS